LKQTDLSRGSLWLNGKRAVALRLQCCKPKGNRFSQRKKEKGLRFAWLGLVHGKVGAEVRLDRLGPIAGQFKPDALTAKGRISSQPFIHLGRFEPFDSGGSEKVHT
jgi:hypothetical protein